MLLPFAGYIGFTSAGVASGSVAAAVQGSVYGGATTGVFSVLQSVGMELLFQISNLKVILNYSMYSEFCC